MRAPFDARVRRALAAVDRADFTPPTTDDDDEQLDPLRELPVPVILQDTHAPTLASSEPVELLAARMGFKQVSVPRVDLTWPPDAVAAAEAAFDGGELEPVTQPAAPQPSPPAWNLADTTRVMAADDVHVRPPAHVGSVVAALDAAGDAARALLERQERAADAIGRSRGYRKGDAKRRELRESFQRASSAFTRGSHGKRRRRRQRRRRRRHLLHPARGITTRLRQVTRRLLGAAADSVPDGARGEPAL
jgi:hypothetical protein